MHHIQPPNSHSLLHMQHLPQRVTYCGGKLVAINLKLPISIEGVLSSIFWDEWFSFTRFKELLGSSLTRSSGMAPGLGDDRGFEVFGTRSALLFLWFTGCFGRNACITSDWLFSSQGTSWSCWCSGWWFMIVRVPWRITPRHKGSFHPHNQFALFLRVTSTPY